MRLSVVIHFLCWVIYSTNATWITKCLSIGCNCMYGRENYPYKSLIQALFLREAACGLNNLVTEEATTGTYNRHYLVSLPDEINLLKMTNMDFTILPKSAEIIDPVYGTYSAPSYDSGAVHEFDLMGAANKYENIRALEMRDLELRFDNNSTLNFIKVFTKLEILDLSNNRITTIKKHYFAKFPLLKAINLNNNNIGSIETDAFQHLTSLAVLQLSKNMLINTPANIPSSLQILTLAENRFGHFLLTLHFPKLTVLDLCGNFLSKSDIIVVNDVKFLRRICLGDNGVGLPMHLNVKAPYLRNITLSASFQTNALLDNTTLEELDQFLSLKDLTLIHYQIKTLSFLNNKTQLVSLKLKHMTFNGTEKNMTKYFEGKDALNKLTLDHSPTLVDLLIFKSNALSVLTNLTYLSLQFTGVKTLSPDALPRLTKLQLDISFNALICDERLQWIVDTRARQPNFLVSEEVTICATPEERALIEELHPNNATAAPPSTTITTELLEATKSSNVSTATVERSIAKNAAVSTGSTLDGAHFLEAQSRMSITNGSAGGGGGVGMRVVFLSAAVGVLSAGLTAFIIVQWVNRKAKTRFDLLRGYSQDMTDLVE